MRECLKSVYMEINDYDTLCVCILLVSRWIFFHLQRIRCELEWMVSVEYSRTIFDYPDVCANVQSEASAC